DYAHLALTENQLEFVLTGDQRRRMALWRTARGGTILDVDLRTLGPLLTVLGGGHAGERLFGPDYAERPNFWKNAVEQQSK
ncbi:MAG: hypothetical protein WA784_15285, partial [Albidovulum sp.]